MHTYLLLLASVLDIFSLRESRCLRPIGRRSRPKLLASRESQSKWLTPPQDRGNIYAMPCGTPETPETRHESAMNPTKFVPSAEKPDTTFDVLYWKSKAGILRHRFPAHPDICVCFRLEHCGMTPIKLAGRTLPRTASTSSTDPRPGSSGTKTLSLSHHWMIKR